MAVINDLFRRASAGPVDQADWTLVSWKTMERAPGPIVLTSSFLQEANL